jgi:hypothetical protein
LDDQRNPNAEPDLLTEARAQQIDRDTGLVGRSHLGDRLSQPVSNSVVVLQVERDGDLEPRSARIAVNLAASYRLSHACHALRRCAPDGPVRIVDLTNNVLDGLEGARVEGEEADRIVRGFSRAAHQQLTDARGVLVPCPIGIRLPPGSYPAGYVTILRHER